MRATNTIKVTPIVFIDILDFCLTKEPSKHVNGKIIGHISAETDDSIVERSPVGQKIKIWACDDKGAQKIIFSGIISDIQSENVNEVRTLTVSVISHSIYADTTEKTRTFQYSKMTYRQVAGKLEKDDGKLSIMLPQHDSQKIGSMLVQYKETNWEFANRIASRLNTVVIPDYTLDTPYISIGMPKKTEKFNINPISYTIGKDIDFFLKQKKSLSGLSERDATYYKVKSREIYDLCSPISLLGRELFVYSINSVIENEELVHYYMLKEKSGFTQKEYFNDKLIGASLIGTVKDVQDDVVKVDIDGDVSQVRDIWFPYSTVYSSPDGTGWYFMPEIGDEIRLHFPTDREKNAYAVSSVHVTHGDRSDPDTKFIRTKYGKAIVFKPDSILITDGTGSSIEMQEENGITIKTNKSMKISASDNIRIASNSKVRVVGSKGLYIQQNDGYIKMDQDSIDITAGHVRIQ